MDARAFGALIRFFLAGGKGRRLAPTMAELHDDALRPQSRTRRPPRGIFAVPANRLNLLPLRLAGLLRVGRFPYHTLAALAAEQFDRVMVVDMTELTLVDAVTAKLLQTARHPLRDLA